MSPVIYCTVRHYDYAHSADRSTRYIEHTQCICVASFRSIAWLFPVFHLVPLQKKKEANCIFFSSSYLRPPTNVAQQHHRAAAVVLNYHIEIVMQWLPIYFKLNAGLVRCFFYVFRARKKSKQSLRLPTKMIPGQISAFFSYHLLVVWLWFIAQCSNAIVAINLKGKFIWYVLLKAFFHLFCTPHNIKSNIHKLRGAILFKSNFCLPVTLTITKYIFFIANDLFLFAVRALRVFVS